jgi:glycosyltransferase involved in cell wall biosynthesis
MILKGYPRISETFISNEILLLEKLGFNIHLISMRKPREDFTHESVQKIRARVDYLPETLLKPLPRLLYHNLILAAKRPGVYALALKTAGRRFLRTYKSATIKHLFQAGYLVNCLLPASGVTHLHAHFAHSPTSVAMFTSQLTGLPFSFTAHAKDIYTSDPRQLREKIGLSRFVVTCTEYNRLHLLKISNGQPTSIHRVYHGIDVGMFRGQSQKDLKPSPPYRLLTIARLTAKKGLPTVLKAVKLLTGQGLRLNHILIGDGDDRQKILALIEELELTRVTRWLGTQPHHEVVKQFRNTDLFVLGCEVASNGDRDGIPNVLLESMAMGVPVVATDISAIPELVVNGVSGLLVPPRQPDRLAQAMLRMLTDAEMRKRVIPAARQTVAKGFDNRRLIRDLARVYRHGMGLLSADRMTEDRG